MYSVINLSIGLLQSTTTIVVG